MNSKGIIGAVVLVVGIALFVMGLIASDSLADQVSKTFTGRFTEATTWYIIGGLACGVGGVLLLLNSGRTKSA